MRIRERIIVALLMLYGSAAFAQPDPMILMDKTITPWAREAVAQFYQWYPPHWSVTSFHGNRTMTRYEAAVATQRFLRAQTDRDFSLTYTDARRDFFLSEFSPSAILPVSRNRDFNDTPPDHWAKNAIDDLTRLDLVGGGPNNAYQGSQPLTRAELSLIIARLVRRLPKQPPIDFDKAYFTDVSGDEWWFGAQLIASGSGIMKGFSDHTFQGNKTVTRNEFVVALWRLMQFAQTDKNPKI
jgi:hypothetical protein